MFKCFLSLSCHIGPLLLLSYTPSSAACASLPQLPNHSLCGCVGVGLVVKTIACHWQARKCDCWYHRGRGMWERAGLVVLQWDRGLWKQHMSEFWPRETPISLQLIASMSWDCKWKTDLCEFTAIFPFALMLLHNKHKYRRCWPDYLCTIVRWVDHTSVPASYTNKMFDKAEQLEIIDQSTDDEIICGCRRVSN